ncbi:DUF4233 domain-containing protein [Vallicoccus soli]|uniref:DUF4233 domain-containing protein n=1 Tax=Vallicoccus soli TaxID=2339232 RepID=A0A3A3ZLL9_9ACTN|nr:DUF4233 domain-containing protein [Vallicoccus soli]RJK97082.1 DUF4233 domain-containing protein [Vallicoccus soli]
MRYRRIVCASVLVSEALVVLFAGLVALPLTDVPDATVWWVTGLGSLACLLLAGMLRRPWAYVAGSVLQVLIIASGLWVRSMFFVGAVFAALWVSAFVLARRVEAVQEGFRRDRPAGDA